MLFIPVLSLTPYFSKTPKNMKYGLKLCNDMMVSNGLIGEKYYTNC